MDIFSINLLIHVVLWNLLNTAAGSNAFSDKDEDTDVNIVTECKVMTECTFYTDLIKMQKAHSLKIGREIIDGELKKQNCGWENDMDPKGKKII